MQMSREVIADEPTTIEKAPTFSQSSFAYLLYLPAFSSMAEVGANRKPQQQLQSRHSRGSGASSSSVFALFFTFFFVFVFVTTDAH
ncbi:hypothetical protein TYRP_010337 [Tyrophagus putrescentiae]|nr:hypothetical protein TYRP_010337 [Tyrophagus putrescentiae]